MEFPVCSTSSSESSKSSAFAFQPPPIFAANWSRSLPFSMPFSCQFSSTTLFDETVRKGAFLPTLTREFTLQDEAVRPLLLQLVARIVRFGEPLVSRLLNTTKIVYMLGIIPQVAVWSDVQRAVLLPLVIEVCDAARAGVGICVGRVGGGVIDRSDCG
jgi:hypothetical protein